MDNSCNEQLSLWLRELCDVQVSTGSWGLVGGKRKAGWLHDYTNNVDEISDARRRRDGHGGDPLSSRSSRVLPLYISSCVSPHAHFPGPVSTYPWLPTSGLTSAVLYSAERRTNSAPKFDMCSTVCSGEGISWHALWRMKYHRDLFFVCKVNTTQKCASWLGILR